MNLERKTMYCANCGKEIDETLNFCMYCGKPIRHDETEESKESEKTSEPMIPAEDFALEEPTKILRPGMRAISEIQTESMKPEEKMVNQAELQKTAETAVEANAASNSERSVWHIGLRIAILIGLLCFFCPFALVSCSNTTVIEGTGMEYMLAIIDVEEFSSDAVPLNGYLLVAFAAGIIGLLCTFISDGKNRFIIPGILTVVAMIGLILFRTTFVGFYGLEDHDKYGITVSFLWGWTCSTVAFGISVVCCVVRQMIEDG
ncbi:MAG: zinc ribbon domain-containing protein [Clostridiales bacterium]|nr:zinc ribbon domain-containing protein [Clostridiales bacterium]